MNKKTKKEWIDFTELFLNIIVFKIMIFSSLLSLLGGISLIFGGIYSTANFLIWLGIATILTSINGSIIYSYSYVNEFIKAKGEKK